LRDGPGVGEAVSQAGCVWIVDADPADRKLLAEALQRAGRTAVFAASPVDEELPEIQQGPADLMLLGLPPGGEGVERLRHLKARYPHLAVLALQQSPHIEQAVSAMKAGAAHVFARPLDPLLLRRAIIEMLRKRTTPRRVHIPPMAPLAGLPELTTRESDVLALIAYGRSSKETGRTLGISPRTVEVHRARLIEKLGARNTADLVRIALTG